MTLALHILVGGIALQHLGFLWLEMFAWTSRGPQVFRHLPKPLFHQTKAMAANQGLYNGFLAVGLFWGLWISDPLWHRQITFFFLVCVAVAGLYGGWSVHRKIFLIQGLPALLAIGLCLLLHQG